MKMNALMNGSCKAIDWPLNDLKSEVKCADNGCGLYLTTPIHALLYDNKIRENAQLIQIHDCDVSNWKLEAITSYLEVFLKSCEPDRKLLIFKNCTSQIKYKQTFRFIPLFSKIRKYKSSKIPIKQCKRVILVNCNTNTLLFEIMYIKRHNYRHSPLIFCRINNSVKLDGIGLLPKTINWTDKDIVPLSTIKDKWMFEKCLMRQHIRLPWIKKKCEQCNKKTNEHGKRLRMCGGCEAVLYCSKHCQKLSWKQYHKCLCNQTF